MGNKILVAGASGNVGREVVAALGAAGLAFERQRSKPAAADGAAPVRVASFEDRAALEAAFTGIDTLFVVLPLLPNKLALAANVAAAAKAAGVRHIVRSSGVGADPAANWSLGRLQGEVDAVFAASGVPCTFLRPATFMQNYVNFIPGMVRAGAIFAGTGDGAQSMIDVRDIAAVAAQVLRDPAAHAGRAYTLTGGQALTDSQRAATLARVVGHPVTFTAVPPEAAAEGMRAAGYPGGVVDWLDSLNRFVAAGHAAAVSPDVERLLGRAPITFERFATDHAAVWRG